MTDHAKRDQHKRRRHDAPPLFADQDTAGKELAVPSTPVLEGDIVKGEFVDERETAPESRVTIATIRAVVTDVATHDRTRTVLRHMVYVGQGTVVVVRRMWDSRTVAPYARAFRAAEALGDQDRMLEWEARMAAYRRDRHARRIDIVELPIRAGKAALWIAGWTVGILLGIGVLLAIADKNAHEVGHPLRAFAATVRTVVVIAAATWSVLVLAAVVVTVLALWAVGRKHADPPMWVRPADQRRDSDGEPITPSVVVVAFRDLGIAPLRKAITQMGDSGAAMLGPIRIAGCGDEVDVTLPSGTSTKDVQDRHRKLAENLGRHEHELHVTIPKQARTVRLWIAHSGALDEPIGTSALAYDEDLTADYYTGRAPWGVNLRGEPALVSVHQRHVLVTGKSNQGKTASLRALALWLALDPTVEFVIGDLKGVGDWRMFDGLASVLIQGPTDEHVIAVTEMVEAAVEEMERRLVALEQSGATDGVTRDMARAPGSGFHPLVVIVDEAQVAFMCPAVDEQKRPYGGQKATSRYFMAARKLHNQGRAVNVTLWQGTQDPTDQNLPKLVREGAHLRGALYLGTESQAKMALGEAPVEAGAAPHKLRDGLDKGTLVVAGSGVDIPAGQPSVTIRTYFVSGEDGAAIAERAKHRRARVITQTKTAVLEAEPRDLLDDLAEVIGAERVKLKDLAARLRELAPGWPAYQSLTGVELGEQLDVLGVRWVKTANKHSLDPAELQRALALRAASDTDRP